MGIQQVEETGKSIFFLLEANRDRDLESCLLTASQAKEMRRALHLEQ